MKVALTPSSKSTPSRGRTMTDLHFLDSKASASGSLHSLNQQSNRQQSSNMENPFKNPTGKKQTKLLLTPGHGRTDHNQPLMWTWRADIRQISSHISANPPIHLLTHTSHVGLQRSSPPLSCSGTGLSARETSINLPLG